MSYQAQPGFFGKRLFQNAVPGIALPVKNAYGIARTGAAHVHEMMAFGLVQAERILWRSLGGIVVAAKAGHTASEQLTLDNFNPVIDVAKKDAADFSICGVTHCYVIYKPN